MKLVFNNSSYELDICDTTFAQQWYRWMFDSENSVDIDISRGIDNLSRRAQEYLAAKNILSNTLNTVNTIVSDLGYDMYHYYHYDDLGIRDLLNIHEKWARITRQAWEQHLSIYDPSIKKEYDEINSRLNEVGIDYQYINNQVHAVEFMCQYTYLHGLSILKDTTALREYRIVPADTSFIRDAVSMPFYDIGRPQYEKYVISGVVDHEEISNYANITNQIEINADPKQVVVDSRFYDLCLDKGVPCYGNYVSIAKSAHRNPWTLGEFLLTNYSFDSENKMTLCV